MRDKILEIGEKKLAFGRAGFYDHIKDATGVDPLQWLSQMFDRFKKTDEGKWEIVSVIDEVVVYAYAGLNLYADIEDLEPYELKKVRRWVRTLSFEECGSIVNAAVESMVVKTNGEPVGEEILQPVS